MQQLISIVVPVYNEGDGLTATFKALRRFSHRLTQYQFEFIFVNDGSQDNSATLIEQQAKQDPRFKLINFSRNFGHQLAITAGLRYADGQAVAVMDADLQDPPTVIGHMLKKWEAGYDVIYGQRERRFGETWFKRTSAKLFYRVLQHITTTNIPVDTGDFRLMDQKVVRELNHLGEPDPFVRGLVSWVGFKQTAVLYQRQERKNGVSKYPLKKMVALAMAGITSFSTLPLKLAYWTGGVAIVTGLIGFNVMLFRHSWQTNSLIICSSFFLSGIILVNLGLLGSYVGRIFNAARQRPRYIIASTQGFNQLTAQSHNEKISQPRLPSGLRQHN